MDRTRIEIHGLPDDDAAARLENQLKGRTGVPEARIDPALRLAEVSYDPALVRPEEIVNWIRSQGYDARFAGRAAGGRGA
ncbi:MAG TPA: heavy-metal-associated domain-containing protein [Longimicrobiales bacterium]